MLLLRLDARIQFAVEIRRYRDIVPSVQSSPDARLLLHESTTIRARENVLFHGPSLLAGQGLRTVVQKQINPRPF